VLCVGNHLDITILAINSLESTRDNFDILVVDDFSIDGTPEYLTKKVRHHDIMGHMYIDSTATFLRKSKSEYL
jgi:glycosyltransferase involved in cell wall biosynthesis